MGKACHFYLVPNWARQLQYTSRSHQKMSCGLEIVQQSVLESRLLTLKNLIWQAKSSSGIPSKTVNDIEVNRDDELWMATKLGLAYFSDASLISEEKQAYIPYFEGKILFENENVTALAFDG